MCQLSSSHLLIHRVPAKLSNRVMPYGENYCQLQLLFVLIVTDLPLLQGLFSVDASPALSVGLMYVFWHHLLKKGYKKEGVFQPPLNFTFIIFQIRNILFLTKILLVSLIYHQILNSTIQLIYPSHTSMEVM